jgi:hypothetical protein
MPLSYYYMVQPRKSLVWIQMRFFLDTLRQTLPEVDA